MSELAQQLKDVRAQLSPVGKIPRLNGRYSLPDRRVLIRDGDVFTLIGHRNKKTERRLQRLELRELKALARLPGFGSLSNETMERMDKERLIRILLPRPRKIFHRLWLVASEDPEAVELLSLVRQARPVEND